jgi:hypothetical protein
MLASIIPVLCGVLMAVSHFCETAGFEFRSIGSQYSRPSLGYSIHVQFATLSRLFTMLAFPMIGFLLDTNAQQRDLLTIVGVHSILFALISVLYLAWPRRRKLMTRAFFFLSMRVSRVSGEDLPAGEIDAVATPLMARAVRRKLLYLSAISFMLIILGLYSTLVLASIFRAWRATMLQLGPILTMAGTAMSTVFFDPYVSSLIDHSQGKTDVTKVIVLGRAAALLITFVLSAIAYLTLF